MEREILFAPSTEKGLKATMRKSTGDEKAISRVVRSVIETFRRRGWNVKTHRSPKSLSRYVKAERGRRRIVVRVSDHPPNPSCESDINLNPNFYKQNRLAEMLDKKKRPNRLPRKRLS